MSLDNPMTFVKYVKGAAASVLWALMFTRRPMSNRELRDWTGYSDKSITFAIHQLVQQGWLTAHSANGPWSLAAGRLLAWISGSGASPITPETFGISGPVTGISDVPAGIFDPASGISGPVTGIFDLPAGNSAPSSSSGTLTESTVSNKPPLLEAAPAEFPDFPAGFETNLQALLEAGIREPAAGMLASLPHVTPSYVRDHVAQVLAEGKQLGAAIYRMRRGWFAPGPKQTGWDPEAVNEKIRRFVEGGD